MAAHADAPERVPTDAAATYQKLLDRSVAYAAYVLAKAGRMDASRLRYLHDDRLQRIESPLARAQLGAALFMIGDNARSKSAFDSAERACRGLIEAGLTLPAYEQVLEASHTFNLLDARRAISVTERQRYILRVREMARSVAQAYYDSRAALGFPMLARSPASAT